MAITASQRFDLKKFWDVVRPGVFDRLTTDQVIATEQILDSWVHWRPKDSCFAIADGLAQTHHETGGVMQPIIETRSGREKANPSVETAIARLDVAFKKGQLKWVSSPYWRKDKRGRSWLGRGHIQLTHEPNYRKADARLRALGVLTDGLSLVDTPDLMFRPDISAPVMIFGMTEGWFRGFRIASFEAKKDFSGSRAIINGDVPKIGPKIEKNGKIFLRGLEAADRS